VSGYDSNPTSQRVPESGANGGVRNESGIFRSSSCTPWIQWRTFPNPMTMRRLSQDYTLVTFLNVVPKFIVNIPN
jgi:hypothetical protein